MPNIVSKSYQFRRFFRQSIWKRERLSLLAFLGTVDIGVHIVHISRVITTYTLE